MYVYRGPRGLIVHVDRTVLLAVVALLSGLLARACR